ncbi:PspA/IM30 family protein [Aminipila sp.]|uniref:PspA/IM30 family protein n=1 Tax=Aminipila sp. TaxID=2060095 RepID=UPI00289741B7|nr:PspA/IM30 family protein [Aminipila sp.]
MSILARFNEIVKANINAVLDKMEDPSKMIDQYLINMKQDLAEVKRETANVMAEETRTKRLVDENKEDVEKYIELAKKALLAGNEADAKVFVEKKAKVESAGEKLNAAYAAAHENAVKMRQMHDKLTADIEELNSCREAIKAKVAVAKTQEKVNKFTSGMDKVQGTMGAFERMEEKADKMLDQANAMSQLNTEPVDEAKALEEKYLKSEADTDAELEKLKRELGL